MPNIQYPISKKPKTKTVSKNYNYSGFTLIELMVAMTIVAVLATIGLVIYSSTQKSGRMSKRIGDLKGISTALESYKAANAKYPDTANAWRGLCASYNGGGAYTNQNYIPGLVPNFMPVLPTDPHTDAATDLCYLYRSYNDEYKLTIIGALEITNNDLLQQRQYIDEAHSLGTCGTSNNARKFAIYSGPNARCW